MCIAMSVGELVSAYPVLSSLTLLTPRLLVDYISPSKYALKILFNE
jgi:hypothetical protein